MIPSWRKDSGAVGIRKQLEKNITLAVGILLKKNEASGKFDVILTRKDIYLKLRERTKIAKQSNADIFISLHADYNKNKEQGDFFYTCQRMHQIRRRRISEKRK